MLRLTLSNQTSGHARNVPLIEKDDSQMLQGLDCMLGVEEVESGRVLRSFPGFVWWCVVWRCLVLGALAFN